MAASRTKQRMQLVYGLRLAAQDPKARVGRRTSRDGRRVGDAALTSVRGGSVFCMARSHEVGA